MASIAQVYICLVFLSSVVSDSGGVGWGGGDSCPGDKEGGITGIVEGGKSF